MVQLSTGDMLRAARTSGTEMGNMVAGVMDRGELVTDEIVIGLIREQLEAAQGGDIVGNGFIFDGFPRTLAQADALGNLLSEMNETLDCVIEMQVDDDALVARITARSTCGACGEVYNDNTKPIPADEKCTNCGASDFQRRADDNEESLRTRLMAYYKQTSPLVGYYYAKGDLKSVDGLASMDGVAVSISKALG
jgi:adenylate kinase